MESGVGMKAEMFRRLLLHAADAKLSPCYEIRALKTPQFAPDCHLPPSMSVGEFESVPACGVCSSVGVYLRVSVCAGRRFQSAVTARE